MIERIIARLVLGMKLWWLLIYWLALELGCWTWFLILLYGLFCSSWDVFEYFKPIKMIVSLLSSGSYAEKYWLIMRFLFIFWAILAVDPNNQNLTYWIEELSDPFLIDIKFLETLSLMIDFILWNYFISEMLFTNSKSSKSCFLNLDASMRRNMNELWRFYLFLS